MTFQIGDKVRIKRGKYINHTGYIKYYAACGYYYVNLADLNDSVRIHEGGLTLFNDDLPFTHGDRVRVNRRGLTSWGSTGTVYGVSGNGHVHVVLDNTGRSVKFRKTSLAKVEEPDFEPGDVVQVSKGPTAGMTGRVVTSHNPKCEVSIEGVVIDIPKDYLIKHIEKENNVETYILWQPDSHKPPKCKYHSYDEAVRVATIMTRRHKKPFYVCKISAVVEQQETPVKVTQL